MITTATDVNGKFAVDLFASAYHMTITDRKEAKNISAAVLEGKQIGVSVIFHKKNCQTAL